MLKSKKELEKIIENAINSGKTLEEVSAEIKKEAPTIDPNIPGGIEFPSIEHVYRRFFVPFPRNHQQLQQAIKKALRAAERVGMRASKGEE